MSQEQLEKKILAANKTLFAEYDAKGATWKLVREPKKDHYFVTFQVPGEDGGKFTYAVMDDGRLEYNFL